MSSIGGSSSTASNKGKGKEIVVEAPAPPVAKEKQKLVKAKENVVEPDGYEAEWESDFDSYGYESESEEKEEVVVEEKEQQEKTKPAWLETLLRTKFWDPCKEHGSKTRADQCMFCFGCSKVTCPFCTHSKPGHRLLKIRRYVYRSVVHASDMQEYGIDISKIQTYIINARKVVHLRPMNRSKHFRPPAGTPRCITCGTWLRSTPNLYCSLVCEGNFNISQDDFSGPEAELRYRSSQVHMAEPSEAAAKELPDYEVEHEIPAQVEPPAPAPAPAVHQNLPLRKRARKQAKPERAPFY